MFLSHKTLRTTLLVCTIVFVCSSTTFPQKKRWKALSKVESVFVEPTNDAKIFAFAKDFHKLVTMELRRRYVAVADDNEKADAVLRARFLIGQTDDGFADEPDMQIFEIRLRVSSGEVIWSTDLKLNRRMDDPRITAMAADKVASRLVDDLQTAKRKFRH
jgi:hypothetical protein